MRFFTFAFLLSQTRLGLSACECGYRINSTNELLTHAVHNDFSSYSDAQELNMHKPFSYDWVVQSWPANHQEKHPLRWRFDEHNVWIENGQLKLRQIEYTTEKIQKNSTVAGASMVSRVTTMYHGSFRVTMSITGANGGSVVAFYWYRNDTTEIDLEILTKESDEIHYTVHPSRDAADQPIDGATSMEKLRTPFNSMQEYRFDWTEEGVNFYQDGQVSFATTYNVPNRHGSIHLDIWASGGLWSGYPSSTNVTINVDSITLFFNTSDSNSGMDTEFNQRCGDALRKADNCAVCSELEAKVVKGLPAAASGPIAATDSWTVSDRPITMSFQDG